VHFAHVTDIASLMDGTPYFVMEYLDGHDLGAALEVDGVLSVTTMVDYAIQVCEALAEANTAGIVHRDIKPSNLFLTRTSDGSTRVTLLDFGVSKYAQVGGDVGITATHALMGSPRYMAPEQMRSTRRVDHRADIWSLGVVMHEALTGHPPFVGETLPEVCAAIAADDPVRVRQLRRDVPIELQDIILRCLAKDPEQRFKDVGELARELIPFATPDAAVAARRVGRIIHGTSVSIPPPPMLRVAGATSDQPPGSTSAPLLPHTDESMGNNIPHDAPPVPLSIAPPPAEGPANLRLRGWAIGIVAAVAIPAFVAGALVSAPPLHPPDMKPTPAATLPVPDVRAVPPTKPRPAAEPVDGPQTGSDGEPVR